MFCVPVGRTPQPQSKFYVTIRHTCFYCSYFGRHWKKSKVPGLKCAVSPNACFYFYWFHQTQNLEGLLLPASTTININRYTVHRIRSKHNAEYSIITPHTTFVRRLGSTGCWLLLQPCFMNHELCTNVLEYSNLFLWQKYYLLFYNYTYCTHIIITSSSSS
jgi:hypothetical protein